MIDQWKSVLGLVAAEAGAAVEFSHRPGDALYFDVIAQGSHKHCSLSGCYLGMRHTPEQMVAEANRIVRMKVGEIERDRATAVGAV